MSTTTTHIDNKPSLRGTKQSYPLVPELRFNEFDGDWNESRLNDVAEFKKGKGISKADISEDGVLECIRYGELYTTYTELIQDIVSKTNLLAKDLILSEFNDVIIPASGELNIDIATASCVLKSGVAYSGDLNIIRSKMDGIFLSFYLNNKRKFDIARLAQGVSVVHLYSSQLKTLKLNFPSLPEQQKIASFLSAVDEKIQQLTKKKELLEQYKKGVMQQLFSGQLRFKDKNGNPYPDWEEKKLKDVLYEHKTKNKDGSVTEVFSVAKQKGVINQIEHLGRSFAASTTLHYKVAFPGDLIYTKSPTKDFPFGIIKQNLTGRKGLVSPLYVVTKPQTNSLGFMFHCYFLSWVNVFNYLVPLVQKGAKNTMNINNDEFLNGAKFTLPVSEKEQQKIARYLSSIDTKIEAVNNQITQTQTFKKGILQHMFV
jgi:type I restriction enzyme S subunit